MNEYYTYSKLGTWGALGNQLWQIAGVVGEASRAEVEIYLPEWEYATYFNIPVHYFYWSPGEQKDFWPSYLQELDHFEHIETYIRDIFQPSAYMKSILIDHVPDYERGKRVVGVHVRRANNLYLPDHHPVPTLDYFEQALDIVPHDEIFVCSDDLDWCRKQSIFKNAYFGVGTPPGLDKMRLTDAHPATNVQAVIDLFLFSMCDSHIISNSSFSWWAAWLGEGEHTVYPLRWYGPALQHININEMLPVDWMAI